MQFETPKVKGWGKTQPNVWWKKHMKVGGRKE